jgi:hypothetical protein
MVLFCVDRPSITVVLEYDFEEFRFLLLALGMSLEVIGTHAVDEPTFVDLGLYFLGWHWIGKGMIQHLRLAMPSGDLSDRNKKDNTHLGRNSDVLKRSNVEREGNDMVRVRNGGKSERLLQLNGFTCFLGLPNLPWRAQTCTENKITIALDIEQCFKYTIKIRIMLFYLISFYQDC